MTILIFPSYLPGIHTFTVAGKQYVAMIQPKETTMEEMPKAEVQLDDPATKAAKSHLETGLRPETIARRSSAQTTALPAEPQHPPASAFVIRNLQDTIAGLRNDLAYRQKKHGQVEKDLAIAYAQIDRLKQRATATAVAIEALEPYATYIRS